MTAHAATAPQYVATEWIVSEFDPGEGLPDVTPLGVFVGDQPTLDAIALSAGLTGLRLRYSDSPFPGWSEQIAEALDRPYVRYDQLQALTPEHIQLLQGNLGFSVMAPALGPLVSWAADTDPGALLTARYIEITDAAAIPVLPPASAMGARELVLVNLTAGTVAVNCQAGDAIGNTGSAGSIALGSGDAVTLVSDGSNTWLVETGSGGSAPIILNRRFDVYDPAYGAVGDGVADDTAAINAALTACTTAGGGIVDCSRGTFKITGPILVGQNAALQGDGGNESTACVFVCASNTASVQFGYATGTNYMPTRLSGIKIDIHGSGDPAGRLQVYCVKGTISNVTVTDTTVSGTTTASMTPGNAVWFSSAQNMNVTQLTADAVQGSAVVLDGGTGGMIFTRCSWTTSGYSCLRITDLTPGQSNGGGFPFGPSCNVFDACIMETRLDDSQQVLAVEAGTVNIFRGCQFSASTSTARMMSGALCNITNDILFGAFTAPFSSHAAFDANCSWNGGAVGASSGAHPCAAITLTGVNVVDVAGVQFVQDVGLGFLYNAANTGTARFDPQAMILGAGNGPRVAASATLSNAKQSIVLPGTMTGFTLTDAGHVTAGLTPGSSAAAVQAALQALSSIGAGNVKVGGGVGAPLVVEFVGALAGAAHANLTITTTGGTGTGTVTSYQAGGVTPNIVNFWNKFLTGPSATVGLTYDATNAALSTFGQFRLNFGFARGGHIATVSSAGFVYAADTTLAAETIFTYINSACSLGTLTLTNPTEGQLHTITHIQPTGGGATYMWPANVQWKGPIPTETASGEYVRVTFKYSSTLGLWVEESRAGTRQIDVPDYVPTLKHRTDPASGLYNERTATGHTCRAALGKVLSSAADAHLLVVSDSSMTGYPGGGAGSYVYDQNPMRGAMRQLARQQGIPWQQGLQWAVGDKSFGQADNWTLTGAFTHASAFLFCNGAGTATRAALPGETGTSVSITYSDLGTNGIPWKINGVSQTALPTTATNTLRTVTVNGLAAGAQVIQIAPTAGQNITITATRVWTPATKGLHLHHCGMGGSRISNVGGTAAANDLNWSSTSNTGTYGLGWLVPNTLTSQGITPSGIVVSLGGNDLALSADPFVTATQLGTMLGAIFPGVPIFGMVHMHRVSSASAPGLTDAVWNQFSGALYGEADTLGCPLFDMDAWEGGIATAAADGLIGTDGTHPTAALMQLAGVQIGSMLWGS